MEFVESSKFASIALITILVAPNACCFRPEEFFVPAMGALVDGEDRML